MYMIHNNIVYQSWTFSQAVSVWFYFPLGNSPVPSTLSNAYITVSDEQHNKNLTRQQAEQQYPEYFI